MTTLLLTENFPPKTGGSGRYLWEIYRRQAPGQFIIAAGETPGQEDFDRSHDVQVHRIPLAFRSWSIVSHSGLSSYWKATRATRRIIRENRAQQIHCARCLPEGWIGWLLRKRMGLPYICFTYGEELNYASGSRELRWLMRRVLQGADYLIAISRNTERIMRDEWEIAPERIRLLYPGVDATQFVPAIRDHSLRDRLGWNDRPVILTVGRLQKRKGHDMMIAALHAIRRTIPNVLYAIVGDGEERESLVNQVADEGLGEHVQFLGEIQDDQLVECYQQCDVFALPNRQVGSDIEGFGMVLLEAQACGKPVVAGASGGTAETMRVPETGLVIPCDSPEPIAQAVVELLLDAERRERMGRAAREWVVERFDWEALSRQAARIFGIETSTVDCCRSVQPVLS